MFGLGWAEMMVVAVVALIVIGPKELPVVFRKLGQFVGKAKAMAREFTRAMNQAADDSGMTEAVDTMNSITDGVSKVNKPLSTNWTDYIPGSETEKLAKKRAAKSKKINDGLSAKSKKEKDVSKLSTDNKKNDVEINNSTKKIKSKSGSKKNNPTLGKVKKQTKEKSSLKIKSDTTNKVIDKKTPDKVKVKNTNLKSGKAS